MELRVRPPSPIIKPRSSSSTVKRSFRRGVSRRGKSIEGLDTAYKGMVEGVLARHKRHMDSCNALDIGCRSAVTSLNAFCLYAPAWEDKQPKTIDNAAK